MNKLHVQLWLHPIIIILVNVYEYFIEILDQVEKLITMAKALQKILLGFVDEPILENCSETTYTLNKIGGLPVSGSLNSYLVRLIFIHYFYA